MARLRSRPAVLASALCVMTIDINAGPIINDAVSRPYTVVGPPAPIGDAISRAFTIVGPGPVTDAISRAFTIAGPEQTQDAVSRPITVTSCPWDYNGDGNVGITDFLALLEVWGPTTGHPSDFDEDGQIGIVDFLALLANWGPCP